MSIILTAGKKPLKKLKKEKPLKRPKTKGHATVDCYIPTPNVVVWNTTLENRQLSIALCKDSISVWCNDNLFETEDNFSDDGAELNFDLYNHKAQIRICKQQNSKAQFIPSNAKQARAPRKNSEQVQHHQVNHDLSNSFNDLSTGRKQSSHSTSGAVGTAVSWDDGLFYELWIDGGYVPEKKMNKPCVHQPHSSSGSSNDVSNTQASQDDFNF